MTDERRLKRTNVPNVNNDYGRLTQHQTSGLLTVISMNNTNAIRVNVCMYALCTSVLDALYLHLSFVYEP